MLSVSFYFGGGGGVCWGGFFGLFKASVSASLAYRVFVKELQMRNCCFFKAHEEVPPISISVSYT